MVVASLWVFFEGIAYTGHCNAETSDNFKGTTQAFGAAVAYDEDGAGGAETVESEF